MKKLIESTVFASNLSKTLIYSIEYRMLYGLSKSFSLFVKPPTREKNKKLIEHMREEVLNIHKQDAINVAEGFYPIEVIRPKAPIEHIKNLPYLLLDSLRVSRRRKLNIKDDLPVSSQDAPDYLKRNYHFQTDGYFSEQSARIYEHQVEVLFAGTAAPMRRMLIRKIKEKMILNRPVKILELGAGVGTASLDFIKSFDYETYTLCDVSAPYLEVAKERLKGRGIEFVCAPAESLPFVDESFDLVFSVYLFHELPRSVREKVFLETHRVLKKDGFAAICDSIQKDDKPILNSVLEGFPIDYHEPFYKDYTLWNAQECFNKIGFRNIVSEVKLLSKYWTAQK